MNLLILKLINEINEMTENILTTGNKDIDWKIFSELNDSDLRNVFLVSKGMSKLSDNEEFFERRMKYWFTERSKKKPKYMTWKGFYIHKLNGCLWSSIDRRSEELEKIEINKSELEPFIRSPMIGDILELDINDEYHDSYIITCVSDKYVVVEKLNLYGEDENGNGNVLKFPKISYMLGLFYFNDFIKNFKKINDVKKLLVKYGDIEKTF